MNFEVVPMCLCDRFCNCNSEDCRCGENNVYEWTWDKEHATHTIALVEDSIEVTFNNGYSTGTSTVRGDLPLEKGRHHYWEVKMISPMYGTDIMVGVGTSKVDVNSTRNVFCSFLGLDEESFGFSYKGYVQYGGIKRNYGSRFGQGCLVGVHLDTWRGTLQFFLNRRPLGIAFSGLHNVVLYPMVSSTAARSKIRLAHSYSIPASLQSECLAVLKPSHKTYLSNMFPTLRYISDSIFAEILKSNTKSDDDDTEDEDFLTNGMIFDEFDFALVGSGRRKRKKSTYSNYSVPLNNADASSI